MKARRIVFLIVLLHLVTVCALGQVQPRTVSITIGRLKLRGLLWQPKGSGPFPAILFCPGSGLNPQPKVLGPVFARHGYVFLGLFRSGQGPSGNQGIETSVQVEHERSAKGDDAANVLQLKLLEGEQLEQQLSGLALLRSMKIVDSRRVGVVGHSFGGMLAMMIAERDPSIRTVINFGGGARSWPRSSYLRDRLVRAAGTITTPVMFVQAANDYSVAPSETLDQELARLRRVHQLKIFPAFGKTASEGHNLVYLSVSTWEHDVFEFLDRYTKE